MYSFLLEDNTILVIDTPSDVTSLNNDNKTFQYKSKEYKYQQGQIDSKYIAPPPSVRMGDNTVEGFIIFWKKD
jgi:hypothetical protein